MPSDLLSIGHVYCAAWKAAYKGIVPDDFLGGLTDESCAPRSHRPDGALVCEENGKIIGVAAFGARRDRTDECSGELYSIYVLPECWRMGAGRTLFDAAKEQLHASGYETLFLWALTENARARCFYEKMGMTAAGSRTITIGGRELEETGYFQTSI
jgi:N-acetylglutamate synthase-like GNAT family acetyltransferase